MYAFQSGTVVPISGPEASVKNPDPTARDGEDQAPLRIDEWPYLQIADRIEDRIRRGEFGEHGRLPGGADLAEWYGVTVGVIAHAREELMRRGLVKVMQGYGTFARVTAEKHPA
jgi:DNA-binding GntR family transcriptional regulator